MNDTNTSVETGDGINLFLRTWPHEEPSATVLIVHGISEHIGRYEHVAAFFNARGYSVAGYDHRGHGRSGGPTMDIEGFQLLVDDLSLVAQQVRSPRHPFIIYAHSMGGLVAAVHAESSMPQPDAYVLSAPALDAKVPAVLRGAAQVFGKLAPKLRMKSSIKGEQLSRDESVGVAYFADPLVNIAPTARFGWAMLSSMPDARRDVEHITTPSLAIHGTEDTLVPPSASAILAGVPCVERKLFPGLRHELHNEPEQDEVLEFVVRWINHRLEIG
ncbi:MAG: alpha/beta hydrolase [Acidimicrobiia bacterium]